MKVPATISFMIILFTFQLGFAQTNPQYGPENGTLIAVGGGINTLEILDRFAELMGGYDQPLVVVPTAAVTVNVITTKQQWINDGFSDVTVIHTRDTAVANTDSFVAPLLVAAGVWFGGGRQWRLVDAYMNTLTFDEFHNVLDRGGVIAGSSAGASIQASFLARGAVADNTIMIAPDTNHRVGFGFLKNSAIDQHIDTRNRWEDLEEIILFEPGLLGIGLSEFTAIVVQGDCFEVIGIAQIAITDSTRLNNCIGDTCYEVLAKPDSFNIQTRLKGPCDFDTTTTSMQEHLALGTFDIYPNPSSGEFYVSSDLPIEYIVVYNLLGLEVYTHSTIGSSSRIDIDGSHFTRGSYFVKVKTAEGALVKKLLVSH